MQQHDGAAAHGQGSPDQMPGADEFDAHMPADVNGLQQQDDAEYGDETMPPGQFVQVSNELAQQRASKKRAADDVKLLANRIALLKLEEKKVSFQGVLGLPCCNFARFVCGRFFHMALSTDYDEYERTILYRQ